MIEIEVNNGRVMTISQGEQYGDIQVETGEKGASLVDAHFEISAGDMVMLINYYRFIKDNDLQCDFVNYNGRNVGEVKDENV